LGCFLPSFDSFGQAVSEENFFLEINQSETRIACGGHVQILYKDCSFHPDPLTNMASTGNSCFWLISKKSSPL
jgi:hypothetical protein